MPRITRLPTLPSFAPPAGGARTLTHSADYSPHVSSPPSSFRHFPLILPEAPSFFFAPFLSTLLNLSVSDQAYASSLVTGRGQANALPSATEGGQAQVSSPAPGGVNYPTLLQFLEGAKPTAPSNLQKGSQAHTPLLLQEEAKPMPPFPLEEGAKAHLVFRLKRELSLSLPSSFRRGQAHT